MFLSLLHNLCAPAPPTNCLVLVYGREPSYDPFARWRTGEEWKTFTSSLNCSFSLMTHIEAQGTGIRVDEYDTPVVLELININNISTVENIVLHAEDIRDTKTVLEFTSLFQKVMFDQAIDC